MTGAADGPTKGTAPGTSYATAYGASYSPSVRGPGATVLGCDSERRREAVRESGLAGIEDVSVEADRRTLTVTFFGTPPTGLNRHDFAVEGGRRVTGVRVVAVAEHDDPDGDRCRLRLTLDRCGDTSVYRLHALAPGFDSRYDTREFSFRPTPAGLDCAPVAEPCPEPPGPAPVIDYLAKDFPSFRRLLLERLSLTLPGWTERHAADLGITLVELLAHVGDRLSYQQDAVATEAYLDTARLRTSVRRHARLVDYPMHDGCASRTFVCLETTREEVTLPGGRLAFTVLPSGPHGCTLGPVLPAAEVDAARWPVFQPVHDRDITLHRAHNRISLWTWEDRECCLPAGTTTATLRDTDTDTDTDTNTEKGPFQRVLRLVPGDVIVFEEVRGAGTGSPADALPSHRQAVRLTEVNPTVDTLSGIPVLDIAWAAEDALTFPFCVSARDPAGKDREVGVARGNTVLVEHGLSSTWADGSYEKLPPPVGRRPHTLRGSHIIRTEAYPRPADIAAAQARRLERLPEAARDRLRELRGREAGPEEADRAFLRTLFGPRVLDRVGLDEYPGAALDTLLSRFDHLLEGKLRRIDALARQARSGYVLQEADTGWELDHTWGEGAWRLIAPDNQALHGPAREALLPDPREALPALRVWPRLAAEDEPVPPGEPVAPEEPVAPVAVDASDVVNAQEEPGRSDEPLAADEQHEPDERDRGDGAPVGEQARGPGQAAQQDLGGRQAHGTRASHPVQRERMDRPHRDTSADARRFHHTHRTHEDGHADRPDLSEEPWIPRRDLLTSGPRDRHLVGESDDDGMLTLRFGSGGSGAQPPTGATLVAEYRIGNGEAGNVGAGTICLVSADSAGPAADLSAITLVRNPLPATGGVDPEPVSAVRLAAPREPFRRLRRAVTAADYATLASLRPGVQRAAAALRWTGSWYEADVAVDALGSADVSHRLLTEVRQELHRFRRIGHDVVTGPAVHVPLEVALAVTAEPDHVRGHVRRDVQRVLRPGPLPGGRLGFFDPDELTFGTPVRVSRLVAAAAAVPGVRHVEVTCLRRLHGSSGPAPTGPAPTGASDTPVAVEAVPASGVLRLRPLEIARLDDDSARPENGRLTITVTGGR
ncbi:putative baseplate assembly protein [Streptomyces sp. NPDC002553]|uniref:putative baseplate assembly protein n=1 Tax=Streptomyces sp. NPDC002553 TaxID=3154417 RepID=UPI00331A8136